MKKITIFTTLAFALFTILPGTLRAQSASATTSASITVTPTLALNPVADLLFPDVLSASGPVENSQIADMEVISDPENDIAISISVPSALTNGGGNAIPLSYGTESATASSLCDEDGDGAGDLIQFDPTGPAPQLPSCIVDDEGQGLLRFGTQTGTEAITADVGTVPAGTYTADIVIDVVLN